MKTESNIVARTGSKGVDAVFIIAMAGSVGKRKAERAATERQSTRFSGRSYLKSIRNDTSLETTRHSVLRRHRLRADAFPRRQPIRRHRPLQRVRGGAGATEAKLATMQFAAVRRIVERFISRAPVTFQGLVGSLVLAANNVFCWFPTTLTREGALCRLGMSGPLTRQ